MKRGTIETPWRAAAAAVMLALPVAACSGGSSESSGGSAGSTSSTTAPTTTTSSTTATSGTSTTSVGTTAGSSSTTAGTSSASTTSASSTGTSTGGGDCMPMAPPPPACVVAPGGGKTPPPVYSLEFAAAAGPADDLAGPLAGATDTGGGFIVDPDLPPPNECDPWLQDCGPGEKCAAWANDGGTSWNANRCVPIDPNPVGPGEPCTVVGNGVSGVDNCDKGNMCFFVDGQTLEGVCVPLCTCSPQTPVCEDTSTTCVISNGGVLNLCLPLCDPLAAQPCADGQTCIPDPGGVGFVCIMDASGGAKAGDPCQFANACPVGSICMPADAVEGCQGNVGCCASLCDLDVPGPCPGANETCQPYFPAGTAPMCLEDVGVCTL